MSSLPFVVHCCDRVVRATSALAPAWRRADLRDEWLGELYFHAGRLSAQRQLTLAAQVRLLLRCCGAVFMVLWMWKHEWSVDMFGQDVRYGLRMLARRPMFAAVAIATLALGIGATTAIFSAVHGVLIRPLPYPEPDRLVRIFGFDTRRDTPARGNLSVPDVADFGRHARSMRDLGAHNYGGYFTVTVGGEAERVARLLVTSGYFRVLGAAPALGRLFAADEDRPSPPDVVVISDGFWRRRFGGDPHIIGKTFAVGGALGTIIGVLPPNFAHPDPTIEAPPEIFALLDQDEQASGRGGRFVRGIARLDAGVSPRQAESELQSIAASLAERFPDSNRGRSVVVAPLAAVVTGDVRAPLLLLQAATCAILLIVCANLANLLLAAGTGRAGELAVRTALGASRGRIARQLLTEGLVMALAGGVLGTALAWAATRALSGYASISHLHREAVGLNGPVLAFALALSISAGIVFGLLPAVQIARASSRTRLGDSPRHTDAPGSRRLRSGLVVAEVALSVVLLVGAMLLVRSFWLLTAVSPGFRTDGVLSLQLAVSADRYPNGAAAAFFDRVSERLRALPGVRAVGAVTILPFSGSYSCDGFQIVGRLVPPGEARCAEVRSASPDYFAVMGIRLVKGRTFTARDDGSARGVLVINEALAREFFPGEDPVGKQIIYSARNQGDARDIVGVVGDVRHFALARDPAPEFYIPHRQPPVYTGMTMVVHVDGDPLGLAAPVRAALREIEPAAPVYNVRSMEQLIDRSVADTRLRTELLALFAALALFLAALGTYGVMSISVVQRTREMGIRLALGAASSDVVRMVVLQGLRPIAGGLAIGLAGSVLLSDAVTGLLFGVRPVDPLTFAVVPAIIVASGTLAAWLPARRACRVDPVTALRSD